MAIFISRKNDVDTRMIKGMPMPIIPFTVPPTKKIKVMRVN
jgi:hypothetical protein